MRWPRLCDVLISLILLNNFLRLLHNIHLMNIHVFYMLAMEILERGRARREARIFENRPQVDISVEMPKCIRNVPQI